MAMQQYSLCWDSYQQNMTSGMLEMFEGQDLVDVTIAVDGKYLKAHKMVLSLCSPYFRELFQVNPCKHPIVFVKDVPYETMMDLLTFMYRGEVQINPHSLNSFIQVAEQLQIKGLTNEDPLSQETTVNKNRRTIVGKLQTVNVPPASKAPTPSSSRLEKMDVRKSHILRAMVTGKQDSSSVTVAHEIKRRRTSSMTTNNDAPKETVKAGRCETSNVKMEEENDEVSQDGSEVDNRFVEIHETRQDSSDVVEEFDGSDEKQQDDDDGDNADEDEFDGDGGNDDDDDLYSEEVVMLEDTEKGDDDHHMVINDSQDAQSNDDGTVVYDSRIQRKADMPRYIVDGFVFHVNIMKGKPLMSYLRCLEYKRLGCHARAVMPSDGTIQDIQLTREHNHPPDYTAEEKIVFLRELKDYMVRNIAMPPREVYSLLQNIYPNAAKVTPYENIKNKLGRWRRQFLYDNGLAKPLRARVSEQRIGVEADEEAY